MWRNRRYMAMTCPWDRRCVRTYVCPVYEESCRVLNSVCDSCRALFSVRVMWKPVELPSGLLQDSSSLIDAKNDKQPRASRIALCGLVAASESAGVLATPTLCLA